MAEDQNQQQHRRNREDDFPSEYQPSGSSGMNLAEEVLTSLHKRENSRDNQFVEYPAEGATAEFVGVTLLQEPVVEEVTASDRGVAWEYHSVTLTRVPGYGFGIAVSGGRDNPHFANGDPAIAISDVLKSGPAEGKLLVNDRILSANGISLENVDYATAVQVLRDSGPSVQLVVKRRVVLPQGESSLLKVTLTKKKRNEDFGIILGCKLYIKEVTNKLADKENALTEGDIVLKINNNSTDGMTLKEAKKLIEGSKEKLQLMVKRENQSNQSQQQHGLVNGGAVGGYALGSPINGAVGQLQTPQGGFKGSNYLELMESRPSYSSQNLYVQPPTRDAGRLNRSGIEEDKNNLMRLRRGEHHGGTPGMIYDPPPPPRPPPPRDGDDMAFATPEHETYSSRRHLAYDEEPQTNGNGPQPGTSGSRRVPGEPRYVTFVKEGGSVGIRLTGGNATGIYVAAVQPNSPAAAQGLEPGDKLLKVNDADLTNMTREDAVLLLLNLQEAITMLVQHRPDEFEGMKQNGDSFFIKTNFNYENARKGETAFKRGDVFHVTDTLHNGAVGSWAAFRVNKLGQDGEKCVIPNKAHAEEFAMKDVSKKEGAEVTKSGSFFRRRRPGGSTRRSKSLNYEEIYSETIKFPAYERVVLKHPGFFRPVVLFGPIADIARERLMRDYPEKFAMPSAVGGDSSSSEGVKPIKLSGIKNVIDQNKHALIDVTPSGVERLLFAQLYPIVVFLKAENKQIVKEIRNGVVTGNKQQSSLSLLSRSPKRRPSTKKLFEDSLKLEKNYQHILTNSLNLSESWYRRVRDAIDREQNRMIWVADVKTPGSSSDPLSTPAAEEDFYLFPTIASPRYSYASSPESENEAEAAELKDATSAAMKSASNVSVSHEELNGSVQLPNYNSPPPYAVMAGTPNDEYQDMFRITKKHRDFSPPPQPPPALTNGNGNPPTLPKNSKLILTHSPPDSPVATSNYSSPPPPVDRNKKPNGFTKSATERLFGDRENYGVISGDRSDTRSSPMRNGSAYREENNYDNTSSYRWTTPQKFTSQTTPHRSQYNNGHHSSTMNGGNSEHDLYQRYTRSPANGIEDAREASPKYGYSSTNGTSRSSAYKPAPPPKTYKPVPPPKPQKMYGTYGLTNGGGSSTPLQESNYMNGKSPDPSVNLDNDNGGFDSGHGSSLDRSSRNYKYIYPSSSSRLTPSSTSSASAAVAAVNHQPYYLNVPVPKNQPGSIQQSNHHPIDLTNREQRGSAFELYRKPTELSVPPQQHHQRVYR